MRMRAVTKIVDARAAQQRVIYWLECAHKVSRTEKEMMASGQTDIQEVTVLCPWCPDPLPEPPVVRDQSANELWRRAGEP